MATVNADRPTLDEPLSYLIHECLLHIGAFGLAQFVLDVHQCLLVLLLMHLLRLATLRFCTCRC